MRKTPFLYPVMAETPRKRRLRLTLSYDGGPYHGWQRQENAATVQGVLEEKIALITREHVRVVGSGRTDAGVHALAQVCHLTLSSRLPAEALRRGLNALLPPDIHVRQIAEASPEFHARYGVRRKLYVYRIWNHPERDVFERRYAWHLRRPLDTARMEEALSTLVGTHDFSSFQSAGSKARTPVRTVYRAALTRPDPHRIRLWLEADGFLRHMVRNIVGTVVDVGLGKIGPGDFKTIFEARDRQLAGIKAPAQGLFLVRVFYEDGSAGDSDSAS